MHRDAMLLIGVFCGVAQAMGIVAMPTDALAYWQAGTSSDLYPAAWSEVGTGYLFYPPVVAQVSAALQPLGWPLFVTMLTTSIFVSIWYCARRWSIPLLAIGLPYLGLGLGPAELSTFLAYGLLGNLQWVLAAATVAAVRRPGAYALLLTTKVTVGVGWWWHVLRQDWRHSATAAAWVVTILGVSVCLSPAMWLDFAAFALANGTMSDPPMPTFPIPFGIRLLTGIALVAWGARTGRGWTVPVAAGWSLPALYGLGFLPFWIGALRLRGSGENVTIGEAPGMTNGGARPDSHRPLWCRSMPHA